MMNLLSDPINWIVVGVTLLVVLLCVGLHNEVLYGCTRYLTYVNHRRREGAQGIAAAPRVRRYLVGFILIILATHVAEMWLFAFGYFILDGFGSLGGFNGLELISLPDYAYYSAMVYTTVGFGDIVPVGPIRFMTGMEALTGLLMITWSASFTFLYMRQNWQPE